MFWLFENGEPWSAFLLFSPRSILTVPILHIFNWSIKPHKLVKITFYSLKYVLYCSFKCYLFTAQLSNTMWPKPDEASTVHTRDLLLHILCTQTNTTSRPRMANCSSIKHEITCSFIKLEEGKSSHYRSQVTRIKIRFKSGSSVSMILTNRKKKHVLYNKYRVELIYSMYIYTEKVS